MFKYKTVVQSVKYKINSNESCLKCGFSAKNFYLCLDFITNPNRALLFDMKISKIVLIAVLCLFVGHIAHSQSNPSLVRATIKKNTDYNFEVESHFTPTGAFNQEFSHVEQLQVVNSGPSPFQMRAIIEEDFVGTALFAVEWTVFTPPFTFEPHLTFYEIEVVESIIESEVDVAIMENGQSEIEIYPLLNDYAEFAPLQLIKVAHVMYGEAEVTDSNTIIYNAPTGFTGEDYIVYSVLDTIDEAGVGNIVIDVLEESPEEIDTLEFVISDIENQLLVFPIAGIALQDEPQAGLVESLSDYAFRYTPDVGTSGVDTFSFQTEGVTRVVLVDVIPVSVEPDYAVDDYYYGRTDETVLIQPLMNDVKNTFPIVDISDELEYVSPGVYSYTPEEGFSGVKVFEYTVDYGFGTATGYIYVTVSDYLPEETIAYSFETPMGQPLVVKYEVPISGYEFNIEDITTDHGLVLPYDENDNVTIQDCGDVSGEAFIIYYPSEGYVGEDQFEVEYCAGGTCATYVVDVEVIDFASEDCLCLEDCVWEGDLNGDGRVNVADLLPLGRHMGYAGVSRDSLSDEYRLPNNVTNWSYNQVNGENMKHIDANGDGIITETDVNSIEEYYDYVSNFVPNQVWPIKDFPFYMIPSQTEVEPGDVMTIDIVMGNTQYPVTDLHGVAFSIQIDPNFADSSSMNLTFFDDSWLTKEGPSLQMTHSSTDGYIEAAVTRTDGIASSGIGVIAQLEFIVEDDAIGIKSENLTAGNDEQTRGGKDDDGDVYIGITLNGAAGTAGAGNYKFPNAGIRLKFNNPGDKVTAANDLLDEDAVLKLVPNPATDIVTLDVNGVISDVSIIDVAGRTYYKPAQSSIDISDLSTGIYFVTVVTDKGSYTEKLQIVR